LLLSSRFETCYQIALAIKKEVEDLEAAGIKVSIFFTFLGVLFNQELYVH